MKIKSEVEMLQAEFVNRLIKDTKLYISEIDKSYIETIMLSGSVSRGDYFPGEMGGMIDLIVMKNTRFKVSAQEIFGKNEDPDIPFHCVNRNGNWYQIKYIEYIDLNAFKELSESAKYALLESQILFDNNNHFQNELKGIKQLSYCEQLNELHKCLVFIKYLLSDYKKDRWIRRGAYIQMHENLNTSINLAIKCIYYINRMYCPAEDRQLYYSFELKKKPDKFIDLIVRLKRQDMSSFDDYERRESIFNNELMEYIERNRPTIASSG